MQLAPTVFQPSCPKRTHADFAQPCLDGAKRLPVATPSGYRTDVDALSHQRVRRLPCEHSYPMPPAFEDGIESTQPGVFLRLPLTGIAVVRHRDGTEPEDRLARARQARVPVFLTEE